MKPNKDAGFTLLEVLLIIIILMIFFVPVLQLLSSGLLFSGEADETLAAMGLAGGKIEELKRTTFASIESEGKSVVSGFPKYSREVIVTESQTNLKEVEVKVYWFIGGEETNISLKTLIITY